MENRNEAFEYTYSAKRQAEIERIRRKYAPKEEDKLEQLRKLDRATTNPGMIWSIAIGVVGCLLFGVGMCCTLIWADSFFVLGLIVGIVGMAVMGMAYPLYSRITKRQREKLAPQILALIDELSE